MSHDDSQHDRQFYQTFAVVIGILFALKLGLIGLAVAISHGTGVAASERNPYSEQLVAERIRPVGQVAVSETAALSAVGTAQATAAADVGQRTYQQACFACHGTGAAGAPRIDDAADWGRRAEQGRDILVRHSIEGFTGERGVMPPKGGQTQLSDEVVIAALDYMLEQSIGR
ncbi:MAG: cytochrome c5 family protein [Gammaproteobacteria bacterium]